MPDRILVVEDDPDLLAFCVTVLKVMRYDVIASSSGTDAREILRTSSVDLVLTDLKLAGVNGLELLKIANDADPETAVIVMTGFPAVDTVVKAMKGGAADYLMKPFSADELVAAVATALERQAIRESQGVLRSEARSALTPDGMIGRSPGMLRLFDDVRVAAAANANVLVLGETGVGKERVALTIHESSPRQAGPFVPINCAAIPEHLVEAELFGYERGAFTGAQRPTEGLLETAHRGTLFLDELGELTPSLQAKLLRALEEGAARRLGARHLRAFDVRFIASTNRNIREEMRRGRFREDLFFRINVIEIQVPPLRDRREDIPLLAAHFLDAASRRRRPPIEGIGPEAMDLLLRYDWPGNIRELKNAVERAVAYCRTPIILPEDLPESLRQQGGDAAFDSFRTWRRKALERLEAEFLAEALKQHHGNVSRTARALRLHRSTLQRMIRKHHLAAAA
jgi:DNA-binding NtrC family response regulator